MTRIGVDRVSLTGGDWVKIVLTVVTAIAGQWLLLQGRVSGLELTVAKLAVTIETREHRITNLESRLDRQREEFIQAVKDLRSEFKELRPK